MAIGSDRGKLLIYLVELVHDGFGLSLRTFPLGLGMVGSYLVSKFSSEVEVILFRTYGELMVSINSRKPDVVGFGYFTWNDFLTLVAARAVRAACPDALIVFGGSNISPYGQETMGRSSTKPRCGPDHSEFADALSVSISGFKWPVYDDYLLLSNYPEIDVIVHGDGEIPMAGLVASYIGSGSRQAVKRACVPGCSALIDGVIHRGPEPELLFDLDVVPSPYISGIFKDFMDSYNLLPQIETIRGCPYKCTFCTIGMNEGKLRGHSFEYSKQEILYLKENYPNTVLRIADPNWGMVKKDVELAKFLRELRDETGYPTSLRVYYSAGGPFENLKKMAVLMKDILPLNMSFQSLNKDTLKVIKRGNMALSKVREMVEFARPYGVATSTELISGLPLETIETFKGSFLDAIQMRLDSIYTGALYLIKGSELYTAEARKKYGFRTKFALVGRDVTRIDGKWVFEADEVVVEHSHMSYRDFFELYKFKIWGMLTYGAAYQKEVLMHCLSFNVSPIEIFDEIISHPERYPFHESILDGYIRSIEPLFFESPLELELKLAEHIEAEGNVDKFYWHRYTHITMAEVLGKDRKLIFTKEVIAAAKQVYAGMIGQTATLSEKEAFTSILDDLLPLQALCIISPLEQNNRVEHISFPFDIRKWASEGYTRKLNEYPLEGKTVFALVIRNIGEHEKFICETKSFPTDAQRYEYYYTVMVSSNMRRYIAYVDEGDNALAGVSADNPMAVD